jgi:hypothetical protein
MWEQNLSAEVRAVPALLQKVLRQEVSQDHDQEEDYLELTRLWTMAGLFKTALALTRR